MNRAQGQITEGEELVQICARAMPSLLSGASGLIVERNEGATLAISCEPVSWSNWLFITAEIALPKMLDYFVDRITKLRLPSTILCTSELSSNIQPVAQRAGYARVPDPVFMVLLAKSALPHTGSCVLKRLTDASMNYELVDIVGSAVGPPTEPLKRLLDPSALISKNIEVFLALRDSMPVATVTTTNTERSVGIWRLVTQSRYQRQGIGQSVFGQIINLYWEQDIDRFYLIANPLGGGLYQKFGFVPIKSLAQWVR